MPVSAEGSVAVEESSPKKAIYNSASSVADNGRSSVIIKNKVSQPYPDIAAHHTPSPDSDTIYDVSTYSVRSEHEGRTGRPFTLSAEGNRLASLPPAAPRPTTWKRKAKASWASNKGLALVMLAQLFAVMMNVTTRLLEMDGTHGAGMHPFQVCRKR